MSRAKTNDQILEIAGDLLQSGGVGAVSFDAIARRLGRSKQAVLYWFPTKQELLAAMFLPWLEAEAGVAIGALADCTDRSGAVTAFVRAVAAYHFGNLDRFRMMYLVPQTIKPGTQDPQSAAILDQVHPVTDAMYAALAARLDGGAPAARRDAVAIHAAVLGLVLMVGLADSLHDPLKHNEAELVDALVTRLTGAAGAPA
jgi:AcrR family transcriptional regulator